MKNKKQKRLFKRVICRKGIIMENKNKLTSCNYIIQSKENYLITKKEIECCRILIKRELRKKSSLYIKCDFTTPLTKKATGVRMGKGKSPIKLYKAKIKIGADLFEFKSNDLKTALTVLSKVSHKLPVDIYLLSKSDNVKYVPKK